MDTRVSSLRPTEKEGIGVRELLGAGRLFLLRWLETGILRDLLPRLQLAIQTLKLGLKLVVGLAELGNSLLGE